MRRSSIRPGGGVHVEGDTMHEWLENLTAETFQEFNWVCWPPPPCAFRSDPEQGHGLLSQQEQDLGRGEVSAISGSCV